MDLRQHWAIELKDGSTEYISTPAGYSAAQAIAYAGLHFNDVQKASRA